MNREKFNNGYNVGTPIEKIALVVFVALAVVGCIAAAIFTRPSSPEEIVNVQPIVDIEDTTSIVAENAENKELEKYIILIEDNFTRLFNMEESFSYQESRGVSTAYSKRDDAWGIFQITPIMLKHFHEIIGNTMFTIEDMFDDSCARLVFDIVQLHDNPKLDIDVACDVWNPGCPKSYRNGVKNEFNRLQK